jgi:hypothetical protein
MQTVAAVDVKRIRLLLPYAKKNKK